MLMFLILCSSNRLKRGSPGSEEMVKQRREMIQQSPGCDGPSEGSLNERENEEEGEEDKEKEERS